MLKYLGALVASLLALLPSAVAAEGAAWERAASVAGVIDIGGPRTDGKLVVAGSGQLFLFDPASGKVEPFARGPGGYHEDPGKEAYIAVSAGGHVGAANCDFAPDETFILREHVPVGVNRVNAAGDESGSFANTPGVTVLTGIAFDTGGSFDGRLLVTGKNAAGMTSLFAIDCNGGVSVISRSLPPVEGGMAVVPNGFGQTGGGLAAPDPVSGRVYAIAANGKMTSIGKPSVPKGPEIGVESVAFVPTGFFESGGSMYYADAGTGHLMRLSSSALQAAGVAEGSSLIASERGAALANITCSPTCSGKFAIRTPTSARGEGHLVFVLNAGEETPPPAPTPVATRTQPKLPLAVVDYVGTWGIPTGVALLIVLFVAAVAVQALGRGAK